MSRRHSQRHSLKIITRSTARSPLAHNRRSRRSHNTSRPTMRTLNTNMRNTTSHTSHASSRNNQGHSARSSNIHKYRTVAPKSVAPHRARETHKNKLIYPRTVSSTSTTPGTQRHPQDTSKVNTHATPKLQQYKQRTQARNHMNRTHRTSNRRRRHVTRQRRNSHSNHTNSSHNPTMRRRSHTTLKIPRLRRSIIRVLLIQYRKQTPPTHTTCRYRNRISRKRNSSHSQRRSQRRHKRRRHALRNTKVSLPQRHSSTSHRRRTRRRQTHVTRRGPNQMTIIQ